MAKTDIDTIAAADSTAAAADSIEQAFVPMYPDGIPAAAGTDTVVAPIASLPVMQAPEGSASVQHNRGLLYDTGSMSLLLMSIFFIIVSVKSGYKYFDHLASYLFSVRRRRENAFDDHTISDVRIMTALVFNTCVMQGLLLFYAIGHFVPSLRTSLQENVFVHVALFTALCVAFHLVQHGMYALLGYVFGDKTSRTLWLSGFKASQSVLGLLLFPVTALLLLYPSHIEVLLTIAISVYALVRIVFIFKGLRIFFVKLSQIVYFILYLCSVEIVPVVMFITLSVYLCNILQS